MVVETLDGRQLLQRFDERLRRAEREAAAAQAEADRITARLDTLRAADARAVRDLARLRLAALGEGGDADLHRLGDAERRVRALLEERERATEAAEGEAESRRAAMEERTRERDAAAERLRAVEARFKAAMEEARARLAADPEWNRLRDRAQEAARIAGHAAQKAGFAREDRAAKGAPYLADPLFAYLWERGYGTARYRAGTLTRMLDGFVARVARFEPARRAFALLDELPERLAEHARRMEEEVREAGAALLAHERRNAADLPEEGEAATLRAALEQAEDALEAAHAALAETERRRAALAAGEDAATQEASALLAQALAAESLRTLREAAERTPTPEDDALVAQMIPLRQERAELEQQIAMRRLEAQTAREHVEQLLALRQEMRQRGYSQDHWNMGSEALLGLLLGQVLAGALSRGGFWDRMEQHRIPGGGGPWGGPWGDGGGFGGGGFRTGGTIGGGGFRTGGSF
ncbi:hypothetical protein [Sabulicella rubraurantiaca]|uniref:hypothetical protein n=1 Tax=Sabulicella rubraurantiaca TaxID=2811429 RepID=UPI001A974F84|nr:hypothetical protein [Sabulicella rubraurantiaca]